MTREARIDLSIIIPAYMEAPRIGQTLDELASFLKTRNYGEVEVVVVTADSIDGTAGIASRKANLFNHFKLVKPGPRVGKGRDVRAGMLKAQGRYRVFMDADLATPLVHLDHVHAFMKAQGVVGIAVRDLFSIHEDWPRKIISKAANLAAQVLVVPGIQDTQCGFKVLRSDAATTIFNRLTMLQWSFDMEMLAIARQLGYPITTFPINDWHDPKPRDTGLSGDSMLKIVLYGFLDPLKIRLNIWRGRYR